MRASHKSDHSPGSLLMTVALIPNKYKTLKVMTEGELSTMRLWTSMLIYLNTCSWLPVNYLALKKLLYSKPAFSKTSQISATKKLQTTSLQTLNFPNSQLPVSALSTPVVPNMGVRTPEGLGASIWVTGWSTGQERKTYSAGFVHAFVCTIILPLQAADYSD